MVSLLLLLLPFCVLSHAADTAASLAAAQGRCSSVKAIVSALPTTAASSASAFCNALLGATILTAPITTITVRGTCALPLPSDLSLRTLSKREKRGFVRSVAAPCPSFMTALGTSSISQVCACLKSAAISTSTFTPTATVTKYSPVTITSTKTVQVSVISNLPILTSTIQVRDAASYVTKVITVTSIAPTSTVTMTASNVVSTVPTSTLSVTSTASYLVLEYTSYSTETLTGTSYLMIPMLSTRYIYSWATVTVPTRTVSVVASIVIDGKAALCKRDKGLTRRASLPAANLCQIVTDTAVITETVTIPSQSVLQLYTTSTPMIIANATVTLTSVPIVNYTSTPTVTSTPYVTTTIVETVTTTLYDSVGPESGSYVSTSTAEYTVLDAYSVTLLTSTSTTYTSTSTSYLPVETITVATKTEFVTMPEATATVAPQLEILVGNSRLHAGPGTSGVYLSIWNGVPDNVTFVYSISSDGIISSSAGSFMQPPKSGYPIFMKTDTDNRARCKIAVDGVTLHCGMFMRFVEGHFAWGGYLPFASYYRAVPDFRLQPANRGCF
ncbi:hypothetical protein PYCC9005_005787 [Savitreella phatthalungensis]